jgi:hypothetical protein
MYVAHSLIIVATCHGMSNLVFSPSSSSDATQIVWISTQKTVPHASLHTV